MGERSGELDFDAARDLPGLDLGRAKRYSRVRLAGLAIGAGWLGARSAVFALSGSSRRLRRLTGRVVPSEPVADALYVAATVAASWLARVPLDYVLDHRVERGFALSTQSLPGWLADRAKGLAVGVALQVPLTGAAYAVIRRRPDDWWLVLSGAALPVLAGLSQLAPVLLMPIFNRFEPLDDSELVARIRALGDRAGVPIADVYRMDLSRQSEKANAFFTGIGRTRRIVLSDTLLGRFEPEEIEGVVAHELGHQVHGDIWRLVALLGAVTTASFLATAKLAPRVIARTSDRTEVHEAGDVASLPLLALCLMGAGGLAAPIQAAVSRAIERRTDRFAVELTGDGATYARALARLAEQNLADPDPPRLLVLLFATNPPIADRIRAARASFPGRAPSSPGRASEARSGRTP
jgi:STE24 endopeptidase